MKPLKINIFFWFYLVFLFLGLIVNLIFSQKQIFFWVNARYSHLLDFTMPWCTDIGNGFFCVFISIFSLCIISIRFGLALSASYALEGIVVQVLKRLIFTNRPRPWAEYSDKFAIHLVPDFTPYSNNSFPSGHTATIFCMAALFVLAYPRMKKTGQVALFIVALSVAYSRIYLSQHYFTENISEGIKVLSRLFLKDVYPKLSTENQFSISLIEIILHYENANLDYVTYRIGEIRRQFKIFLKGSSHQEEKAFLKLLQNMCNKADAMHDKQLLTQMEEFVANASEVQIGSGKYIELGLWVRSKLDKKHYYDYLYEALQS